MEDTQTITQRDTNRWTRRKGFIKKFLCWFVHVTWRKSIFQRIFLSLIMVQVVFCIVFSNSTAFFFSLQVLPYLRVASKKTFLMRVSSTEEPLTNLSNALRKEFKECYLHVLLWRCLSLPPQGYYQLNFLSYSE